MFEIEWKEGALKQLTKLEPFVAKRIYNKIEELKENPFSKDVARLVGRTEFKFRVGEFRVLFMIENDKIVILRLGHRKNIYDL